MVGRAYAYGLGAAGGAGVSRAIEILRADLIRTLKLIGCASIAELDRSFIDVPPDWQKNNYAIPLRFERRQNQIQRMAAMISAIQLTPIGMLWVPSVTWV